MDELQRKIHCEAAVFCLGMTAVGTTCYGHLEWVGAPQLNWAYLWVVLTVLYGVGCALAQRHYR